MKNDNYIWIKTLFLIKIIVTQKEENSNYEYEKLS